MTAVQVLSTPELESLSDTIGTFHLLFGGFGVPYGKVDGMMEGGNGEEGDLEWEKGSEEGGTNSCRLKRFQPRPSSHLSSYSSARQQMLQFTISADPFKYSKRYSLSGDGWISRWAKKSLLIT